MIRESSSMQQRCKKCGATMENESVLCVQCGHHSKAGMNIKNVVRAKKAGRVGIALVVSGIVAFVCAAAWAGIAVGLNMEIGYIAWGIGFLTGLPIILMTEERSARTGMAAAGMALAALLMGKLLIIQWGVVPDAAQEIASSDETMVGPVIAMMAEKGEFNEAQLAVLDSEEPTEAEIESILSLARTRLSAMPKEEKVALARKLAEAFVSEMSLFEKIQMQCSFFDILWILLAMGTAWKMASEPSIPDVD
jgi:hypothetical protein